MRMIKWHIQISATPKSPKGDFRNLRECKRFGTLAPYRGLGVKMRKYIVSITYIFSRLTILLLLITSCSSGYGQNPIIKDIGMSDPHIRIFNDTIFLFTGHDSHPDDKIWVMKNWRIFSSTDLMNWNLRSTISPADNYMGSENTNCWAADAASRNGKFYFYFSDQKRSIGVMVSDAPAGKYKDALGKPLVAPMHDPTILIDDDKDKSPYLIYGDKEGGGYHIAKLNDDMISLAETPKAITISGEEWEKAPKWMDKNYMFKYRDTYYLSWGRDYAISKNIYGPFVCQGSVGQGHNLNEFAHGSFFWWKGQFYHIWTYYIRSGYKYRECIISYCHIGDDGRIVTDTDFLDQHSEYGVGHYNASWPVIQAEWFTGKSENITKVGTFDSGFQLSNIEKGSWVKFTNMDFGSNVQKRKINAVFSQTSSKISFQVRLDSPTGKIISKGVLSQKRDSENNVIVLDELENVSGIRDIYLIFNENIDDEIKFDRFRIISN